MINNTKKNKVVFAIIGSGWRAEFYLRIAREMPDRFEVCGLVTRSQEKAQLIENKWKIRTYKKIVDLLKSNTPAFVVVSVPKDIAPSIIMELASVDIPVLVETPPAPDLCGLIELNKGIRHGSKIQVAEQYHLQPMHAARIAIANSGILGDISHVQVSFSNGYHAISIIRKLLGIKFENAKITASKVISPFVAGPGRNGLSRNENIINAIQQIAVLDFGGKSALYDFAQDQHRSFVRSNRVLVRGNRGEINNKSVRYLKDFRTPMEYELKEVNTGLDGNMENYFIKGIIGGEQWLYVNPFISAKLSEDEIAIASCLEKMETYVKGGASFYSLAEASQDHYLGMMINKAAITNEEVITNNQPWC